MTFDSQTTDRDEIVRWARSAVGQTLGQLSTLHPSGIVSSAKTKGTVGSVVETYFGIVRNNSPLPDFREAGVELKSVPLRSTLGGLTTKERTVVSQINYAKLVDEAWESASVRSKISAVLFVFYHWREGVDIHTFQVVGVTLWTPSAFDFGQMRQDWERVRAKVAAGQAHLLSEADGRILGPATKGADGSKRVRQPQSDVLAKPRAWAFKASVTNSVFLELKSPVVHSLVDRLDLARSEGRPASKSAERLPGLGEIERGVLRRIEPYVGEPLGVVADELSVRQGGKAFGARIVRRAVGMSERAVVEEFERVGLQVKIVRMSPRHRAYEAMSFPRLRYFEFVAEEWEDSDLLRYLNRLMIIPLIGANRDTPVVDCLLQQPFFWSPTASELDGIEREWRHFQAEIRAGLADRLTPASQTRYIHVRPKGRDSRDTEPAPVVGPVVKKCFWLNKPFVERIIADAHGGALRAGA